MDKETETRVLQACIGIQLAQCRYYVQTLGPNVGISCVLGSLGGYF